MTTDLLTRIDSYLLRTVELERDITREELAKRVKSRYGVDIDVQARLREYTPPDNEPILIYWS